MSSPMFSVIIPTLNEEKFLPRLLMSLKEQSVKNFEVIVADGESTDRTVAVVKQFINKLPLSVYIGRKPGVSHQRNLGAEKAIAPWLIFVDADGVLLPNFFERISLYIKTTSPKFFTTWFVSDEKGIFGSIVGFLGNMSVEANLAVRRPWAPGPMTIVRKDEFTIIGGYDEKATFGEDHDFSMMAKEKGIVFSILRESLYVYSMRRFREEGYLRSFFRYCKSFVLVLFTKRGPKNMPGFVSGGGRYEK